MTTTNTHKENKAKALSLTLVALVVLVVIAVLAVKTTGFDFANASFEVYIPFLFNAFPRTQKSS